MIAKHPVTGEAWEQALIESVGFLNRHSSFLFCGYPDADALGSMLSLALHLKSLGKRTYVVWPGPVMGKTDFLETILHHNRLPLLKTSEEIRSASEHIDAVIVCDTANRKLVPLFTELKPQIQQRNWPLLELDHHFGTDSEPIATDGLHLFRQANATTEIAAQLLRAFAQSTDHSPDPFDQRNIVVCLLTGMIADTGGGNACIHPEDYEYWTRQLGRRLKRHTRTLASEERDAPQFASPEEIWEFLVQLSDEEKRCVEHLQKRIDHADGVGALNLLESTLSGIESARAVNRASWAQVFETMANAVPEIAGSFGLMFFQDTTAENEDCYTIKIRRATSCSIDLRETEPNIQSAFGPDTVLGGGGHPGAVSFRIRRIDEASFLEGIERQVNQLRATFR